MKTTFHFLTSGFIFYFRATNTSTFKKNSMIINKIFLFLILSIFFSCTKQKDEINNDLTARNLKGNIKSLYEWSYRADSLSFNYSKFKREYPSLKLGYNFVYIQFDTLGKIQKHDLNNEEFTRYVYNLYGDKTEIITKFDTLSDDVYLRTSIKYESMHRISEVTNRGYPPLIQYYYTNDLSKDIIKEKISYDMYDRKSEKHIYKYGKNDSICEYQIYDYGKNDITLKEIYKYDNSKNLILKEVPIADVSYKETGVYKYKYNDKNDLVEEIYCFSVLDGIAGSIEINPNYHFDDQMCKKIIYRYDYDKIGNWVKKIKIEKDGISRVYDRKIEYY